jgi:uncharacterized protein YdeI (YjbR/CyaY-like superfamily)
MTIIEKPNTLSFKSSRAFRSWLSKHHAKSDGFWMRIFKKTSGEKTITYNEAVDQALCFGWIDGQKKPFDEISWLQKFTPRRPRSPWSKINTERVARLIDAGEMTEHGMRQVDAAKRDGRWDRAYSAQREAVPPDDLIAALGKNKKAQAFFEQLTRSEVYVIVYRLQAAKRPETRAKRLKQTLENLAAGLKPRSW